MAEGHLDPAALAVLELMDGRVLLDDGVTPVDDARESFRELQFEIADPERHVFDGVIADELMGSGGALVAVRRYTPRDARPGAGVAYFHGGGWVVGDLDTADRFARGIARVLGVVVVSVDYRRAPEHPYPAAFDDCRLVTVAMRREFDGWLAVAGDSAGGNLALAVALGSAAETPVDAQLLVYPCIDSSMRGDSYTEYAEGFGLTRSVMDYFWRVYAGEGTDPLYSPLASGDLSGLPPTVLASAGIDVLRDDSRSLASRLIADDVELHHLPSPTLPHGFIEMTDRVDAAREAVDRMLRSFLALLPERAQSR